MRWSNINYLKEHCRIDYDCEDALIEQYGEAAEEFVLAYINRTYENLIDIYQAIPARLYEAVQLLVDTMYENRSIVTITNMSVVPYTFDAVVSDFVRHTEESPIQNEFDTLMKLIQDLEYDFRFAIADIEPTAEITTIDTEFVQLYAKYNAINRPTKRICEVLREKYAEMKTACDPYINPQD